MNHDPSITSVASLLREAAHYMASHRFIQGDYYSYDDTSVPKRERHKIAGCCARGAIHACAASEEDAEVAIQVASDYVGEPIDDFNDDDGRTKEEVVEALRLSAEWCEYETEDEWFKADPEDDEGWT